jgi:hypothetical protein
MALHCEVDSMHQRIVRFVIAHENPVFNDIIRPATEFSLFYVGNPPGRAGWMSGMGKAIRDT